jgi:hypothetical protein
VSSIIAPTERAIHMADEQVPKEAEVWEEAVKAYAAHHAGQPDIAEPDPTASKVILGAESIVILRTVDGLPLGQVSWYAGGEAIFEPPTKVTVVEHFQGLRPKKP